MGIFPVKFITQSIIYIFLSVLIASCAVAPEKVPEPAHTPVIKREIKPVEPKEIKKEEPILNVAIVLSGDTDAYKNIARLLSQKLGEMAKVYVITQDKAGNKSVISSIQSSSHEQVVAIGLAAATSARSLHNKPVIFCQVLNHKGHELANEAMKGISAFPATDELFKDWKTLSPDLKHVTVITGKNLDNYFNAAKKSAKKQGVELVHKVVATDKEFLYASKNLPAHNQGLWFFPDNRVLSRLVLKESLTFNAREGKQSVVFSPALLRLGGLFYTVPSEQEISELVYQRLVESAGKQEVPGVAVLPLQHHEIGINPIVAKQLGIEIPAAYRKYIYE